ncbi:zinc finger protein 585A-like [Sitophilus oryzae]|uniref:Zinc finger protein 585A-like n=1 Tax=Sitophilus oryzae TaxID=7048 RepID=A0A6J2YSM7_SITOR|nr:zinc finger protein 585A-like [Sitophilus oryzae]
MHCVRQKPPENTFSGLFLGSIIKKFKCMKCDKSYKHKPNLYRHSKYECDGVPRFVCEICGKAYTQKVTLKQHVDSLHFTAVFKFDNIFDRMGVDLTYLCEKCNKGFKILGSLKRHMKYYCGRKPPPVTGYVQIGKSEYECQKSSSFDNQVYTCETCSKVYYKRISYYIHKKYDCGNLPQLKCSFADCGKTVSRRSRPFACDTCGNRYARKNSLYIHQRYDCGVKQKQFYCQFDCQYSANRKHDVKRHLVIYSCDVCRRTYTKWSSLYVHMKYDCGDKRVWTCQIQNCNFKSTRTGNMKRHISGVHGIYENIEEYMSKAVSSA